MFVLTYHNHEENSRDGVSLTAVSDDILKLQDKAVTLETERLREELANAPIDELAPVANLAWADWGIAGSIWLAAEVPWGMFHIEEVEQV